MRRPTIAELAQEAGVSVSTINRILSGGVVVRGTTMQRVQRAAERIGFNGLGTIAHRIRDSAPHFRFGFVLQQSKRELYQIIGKKIIEACRGRREEVVEPLVEFIDQLTPDNCAARLLALGRRCDAVALTAADHPVIGQAIRELQEAGKPVVTYISDHAVPERAAHVGTDNWKLGRTAAYLMTKTINSSGRIAVLLGNHRYQCQDIADASFRSYIREHAPHFTVEESRPTQEESDIAFQIITDILYKSSDLIGILVVGGGVSGVLKALRQIPEERRKAIRLICRDIGPETRKGLSEGLITAALCHPLDAMSDLLVQTMIDVARRDGVAAVGQRTVAFEILTPENL
ncbi:LacI family DNA-binding transcriptional regulator [Acidocella facilis]|uniref:LacI family DNA-binding transcriptional regulator n=1 Tax=Acidocella facilis TaxID=525 RepID=UPI001F18AF36|nr:LacI family DNA-binding transcriptional regulator [Acidocella facilis]